MTDVSLLLLLFQNLLPKLVPLFHVNFHQVDGCYVTLGKFSKSHLQQKVHFAKSVVILYLEQSLGSLSKSNGECDESDQIKKRLPREEVDQVKAGMF